MHSSFKRAIAIYKKLMKYRTEPAYWRVWADGGIINDQYQQGLTRARNLILVGFDPRDVIKWNSSPLFFTAATIIGMLLSFKQTVVVASTYATMVNKKEWRRLLYRSLLGGGRLGIGIVTHSTNN